MPLSTTCNVGHCPASIVILETVPFVTVSPEQPLAISLRRYQRCNGTGPAISGRGYIGGPMSRHLILVAVVASVFTGCQTRADSSQEAPLVTLAGGHVTAMLSGMEQEGDDLLVRLRLTNAGPQPILIPALIAPSEVEVDPFAPREYLPHPNPDEGGPLAIAGIRTSPRGPLGMARLHRTWWDRLWDTKVIRIPSRGSTTVVLVFPDAGAPGPLAIHFICLFNESLVTYGGDWLYFRSDGDGVRRALWSIGRTQLGVHALDPGYTLPDDIFSDLWASR